MAKHRLILVLMTLLFITGCTSTSYKKISAQEGREILQGDSAAVLLDVRTVEENSELRIPDSLLIPLNTLKNQAAALLPDKTTTIVIYCRSGNRSKEAADLLIELGYENVYDMGGILDWPYETESD